MHVAKFMHSKCGNGGISDAVTSELGDTQSSHPVKTLLQYYGKSLETLPGVAYPGFRDNRSTLNTKTGFKKKTGQLLDDNFNPYPVEQYGSDCRQPISYLVYRLLAIAAILFYWIRITVVQQLTCLT